MLEGWEHENPHLTFVEMAQQKHDLADNSLIERKKEYASNPC